MQKIFENRADMQKFQIWIWEAFVAGAICTPEDDRWGQGTHMSVTDARGKRGFISLEGGTRTRDLLGVLRNGNQLDYASDDDRRGKRCSK